MDRIHSSTIENKRQDANTQEIDEGPLILAAEVQDALLYIQRLYEKSWSTKTGQLYVGGG